MRRARIYSISVGAVYHCTSSIVEGVPWLDDDHLDFLRALIDRVAIFSGVDVITFSLLNGHFHMVVYVPLPKSISDEELLRRVEILNGRDSRQAKLLRRDLRERGHIDPRLRARYLKRMYNISVFNQEIKQRFTRWFNRENKRRGPLWGERFHSVVAPPRSEHALVMAIYDDLNALRAFRTRDPLDYRWCGYAEAMRGNETIRQNMVRHLPLDPTWEEACKTYRVRLFGAGGVPHDPDKAAIELERIEQVIREGGELSQFERLRCKVPQLKKGGAFAPKEFAQQIYQENKEAVEHGRKHPQGPCPMKEKGWEDFHSLWEVRSPR